LLNQYVSALLLYVKAFHLIKQVKIQCPARICAVDSALQAAEKAGLDRAKNSEKYMHNFGKGITAPAPAGQIRSRIMKLNLISLVKCDRIIGSGPISRRQVIHSGCIGIGSAFAIPALLAPSAANSQTAIILARYMFRHAHLLLP
jgi:hypothetical protein